jgi:hypothetical protein
VSGEIVNYESLNQSLEIDIKMVDEEFKEIILYLKNSSIYITNKNYSELVQSLVDELSMLGVSKEYLKELKEI